MNKSLSATAGWSPPLPRIFAFVPFTPRGATQ